MLRNAHIWLPEYIKQQMRRPSRHTHPIHIMFSIVDHFEPRWGNPPSYISNNRVDTWIKKYQKIVLQHRDADSVHPRHSIFYPQEEYSEGILNRISDFCKQGFGEVEIHLHHDDDTAEGLRQKIEDFKEKLLNHGLLSQDRNGNTRYGFIHGNWALDNSRRDGRWCGVNNELEILRKTGCYADFTLPSAPSDTQTSKINSIYYATDTHKPKSHDKGIDVQVGKEPSGDLMIIQGPLALNWKRRKIENSGISFNNPPTRERVDLWVEQHISVKGKPDWIFVKVYTHGLQDDNLKDEFFENLDSMFVYLEEKYNDGKNYKLHYATAREMYNIIKAAEAGEKGEPGEHRDYILESNINLKVMAAL